MSFRRMLPFIFINIVVSATVVLAILWIWDGRKEDPLAAFDAAPEIPQALVPQDEAPAAESVPTEASAVAIAIPEEEGPEVHIVGAGETLGVISTRYDISIEVCPAVFGAIEVEKWCVLLYTTYVHIMYTVYNVCTYHVYCI